jgi:hypothetical protein
VIYNSIRGVMQGRYINFSAVQDIVRKVAAILNMLKSASADADRLYKEVI